MDSLRNLTSTSLQDFLLNSIPAIATVSTELICDQKFSYLISGVQLQFNTVETTWWAAQTLDCRHFLAVILSGYSLPLPKRFEKARIDSTEQRP